MNQSLPILTRGFHRSMSEFGGRGVERGVHPPFGLGGLHAVQAIVELDLDLSGSDGWTIYHRSLSILRGRHG